MSSQKWKDEHPEEMRRYRREWYARNKKHAQSKVREREDSLNQWLDELKSTLTCSRCHQTHIATLQFHHVNPQDKEATISNAVHQYGWSKKRVLEEISKCVILCANCHAIEHYEQKHGSCAGR